MSDKPRIRIKAWSRPYKADVVSLGNATRLDTLPEAILEGALEHGMLEVVVCGYDANGQEYFAASCSDGADAVWHLTRAQYRLMRIVEEIEVAPPPKEGGTVVKFPK